MKLPPYTKSAPYYDLIYEEAVDYEQEGALLQRIFQDCGVGTVKRILDLGSGTGNHALILSSKGYDVFVSSPWQRR